MCVAYLLKRAPCNCLTLYKRLFSPLTRSEQELRPSIENAHGLGKKLFFFRLCGIIDTTTPTVLLFVPKKSLNRSPRMTFNTIPPPLLYSTYYNYYSSFWILNGSVRLLYSSPLHPHESLSFDPNQKLPIGFFFFFIASFFFPPGHHTR